MSTGGAYLVQHLLAGKGQVDRLLERVALPDQPHALPPVVEVARHVHLVGGMLPDDDGDALATARCCTGRDATYHLNV